MKVSFVILPIFLCIAIIFINKPTTIFEDTTQLLEQENHSKAYLFEEGNVTYTLEEYMDINPYVFGLLSFDDNGIRRNIPVVESRSEKWGDYWMEHNVFFEKDTLGCAFLDEQTPIDTSNNLRINGHASYANNRMFTFLKQYQENDYFNTYATFQFNEIYAISTYEIIFMARYDVESDTLVSAHWMQANLNKNQVEMILKDDKENIIQSKIVDLTENEKYMTLITCDMQHKNYRYVVFAHEVERKMK